MKILISTIVIALSALTCHANDDAKKLAKSHLSHFLKADYKKLTQTYSKKVKLMPGHEFLKKRYGLSEAGDRSKSADVDAKLLIEAMVKASEGRPARPQDRVEKLLDSLKYELIKVTAGDFVTEASDPIGTPDGKLHFAIIEGDILLKVSPTKGDFLLVHLREVNKKWKVVSEYLD